MFTAQGKENLTAASFYATGKDSEYELYVVNNFEDENSFKNMKKVAEGSLKNAGYYTIDFSEEIPVEAGERYAVCLRIKTPNAVHPLAIEYAADKTTASVDLTDGEGYISASGSKWVDVTTIQKCNLCIKAFSNNR